MPSFNSVVGSWLDKNGEVEGAAFDVTGGLAVVALGLGLVMGSLRCGGGVGGLSLLVLLAIVNGCVVDCIDSACGSC